MTEADLREANLGGLRVFLQSLALFNPFEEMQTVLFQAELIIDNAPLTYVYPNTFETCLAPNYLLFGRQLLYSR